MHESLERDIRVLEARLQSLKTEQQKVSPREAVKEHLASRIYGAAAKPAAPVPAAPSAPPADNPVFPAYMKQWSDEDKFVAEKLIDIAWHKGIDAAVREAEGEGAFMLDAFHDALTDKLYEDFKRRGLI